MDENELHCKNRIISNNCNGFTSFDLRCPIGYSDFSTELEYLPTAVTDVTVHSDVETEASSPQITLEIVSKNINKDSLQ